MKLLLDTRSILSIELGDLAALQKLPIIHRDPFDRMLIAQTISNKLTLVTKDADICKYNINLHEA